MKISIGVSLEEKIRITSDIKWENVLTWVLVMLILPALHARKREYNVNPNCLAKVIDESIRSDVQMQDTYLYSKSISKYLYAGIAPWTKG